MYRNIDFSECEPYGTNVRSGVLVVQKAHIYKPLYTQINTQIDKYNWLEAICAVSASTSLWLHDEWNYRSRFGRIRPEKSGHHTSNVTLVEILIAGQSKSLSFKSRFPNGRLTLASECTSLFSVGRYVMHSVTRPRTSPLQVDPSLVDGSIDLALNLRNTYFASAYPFPVAGMLPGTNRQPVEFSKWTVEDWHTWSSYFGRCYI